jgi:hypothetical protein
MLRGPEVVLQDVRLAPGEWDEPQMLVTKEGHQRTEHGQSVRTPLEAISPEQAEARKDAERKKAELLAMTKEILDSETRFSDSLAANIRSFHHAVGMERQISENQEPEIRQVDQIETLVSELKGLKRRMDEMEGKIEKHRDVNHKRGEAA